MRAYDMTSRIDLRARRVSRFYIGLPKWHFSMQVR